MVSNLKRKLCNNLNRYQIIKQQINPYNQILHKINR